MSGQRSWILCEGCGRSAEHQARNLCARCYWRYGQAGLLHNFERTTRRSADVVEDYEFLVRTEGLTRRLAAERMGIGLARLEKAIQRQQQASRMAS